ncbi:ArsA family ATPase [Desulfobotulus sp. H1]|uniref:arsenite-transporting ATPase n=1 Tax=Desulfobotulus pelophilus TaxID=2823377 RepID=A0ABT3N5C8_9BACT|nr:ArsA family ATPase [Desulfobotulus pelophilus]MCW7752664.1 ArsA family ATPase [Desulfobotulus pelophilus]
MRILLFTGKGGAGKTTTAAATALQAARSGRKTLVMSTDPAHSLADVLNLPLGPEPVEVEKNLWAQELDIYYSMRKHWGSLRRLMLDLFRWQGVDRKVAEELAAIPGMEEGSAFLWIEEYVRENRFDLIVIDSAPTGETLTLLSLPQVTQWWTTQMFPFPKMALRGMGRLMGGMMPMAAGLEELSTLLEKMERVQKILADPEITSTRIMVNPERMVIAEARRAYTYLQLYGYHVDAVITNRILPEGETTGFFSAYVASQSRYLAEIEESFAPLPMLRIPHFGEEIVGLDLLEKTGKVLYGDRPGDDLLFREKPLGISEVDGGYVLTLRLPFLENGDVGVERSGDTVTLQVGSRRRHVFLPRFLAFYSIWETLHLPPELKIFFEKRPG